MLLVICQVSHDVIGYEDSYSFMTEASHLIKECQMKKTVTLTKGINPLSPDIHLQTLHTDLYTFPLRIS